MSIVALVVIALVVAQVIALVFWMSLARAAAYDDEVVEAEDRLLRENRLAGL